MGSPQSRWWLSASDNLHRAMLLTLPWIGVGCVKLLLGRDTGAGFQPAYLLLAASLALRAAGWLATRGNALLPIERSRLRAVAPGVAILLAAGALSALGVAGHRSLLATPADAWWRFAKQMVQLGVMLAFLVECAVWTRTSDRWRSTARWLGAGLVLQIVYGAWQTAAFFHPHALFAWFEAAATSNPAILSGSEELYLGAGMSGLPRVRGTAAEPLYLGHYLLMVLPVLWSELRGRYRSWLLIGGFALLVATWSRGAGVGAVVGLAGGLSLLARARLLGQPRRRWVVIGLTAAATAGVLLVVLVGPRTLLLPIERLLQTGDQRDWSNLTRTFAAQAAWRGFLLSPWVGIGWGQFGFHFPLLVDPLGLQSQFTWPVPGNFALQVLCETGLVGTLAVLFLVFRAGRAVWQATTASAAARDPLRVRRIAALAAGALGCAFQLLTFSQYNLPHIWVGWGLLAAALLDPVGDREDAAEATSKEEGGR